MSQFVDFKQWLKSNLNAIEPQRYEVTNERQINSDLDKVDVVVSALAGTPYTDGANIPYQIEVFTTDVDQEMENFSKLAKTTSRVGFNQIINEGTSEAPNWRQIRVIPFLNTPVVMDKDIEIGSNHYARIVVFASTLIFYEINDIETLKIDNDTIETLSSAFSYVAELIPNRISGQELTKSKKKAAATSITFTAISRSCNFMDALNDIAMGNRKGNIPFTVKITLTSKKSYTLKMIVSNYSLATQRTQMPTVNVTMFVYDERGGSNNASN